MKYLENLERDANFCIAAYSSGSGKLMDEHYFVIDEDNPHDVASALKYICNNHHDSIDVNTVIKFHNVANGIKEG